MTVKINPDLEDYPNSKVSIKIFKNGSIQMSGIKSITAINNVLTKLITELKREFVILDNNDLKPVLLVDDINKLEVSKFKIDMINCGFKLNYEINRDNTYQKLLESNISVSLNQAYMLV